MRVFSGAYLATLASTAAAAGGFTLAAGKRPGPWVAAANWFLAAVLAGVTVSWIVRTSLEPDWTAAKSLPVNLTSAATIVAALALVTRQRTLVELTWFWGLAGALQSLLTPNLRADVSSVEFLEYVLAHVGIVTAAFFLVLGQRLVPRRMAVPRVLAITIAYTAVVGVIDAVTGGNYMYLRRPPRSWTLLKVLGPWPWYLVGGLAIAVVLFLLLDSPFRRARGRAPGSQPRRAPATAATDGSA